MPSKNVLKQIATQVAKIALIVGLLYFLTQKGLLSLDHTRAAFRHQENVIPAFVLMFITAFMGAIRWQWLLKAQNIELPLKKTTQLTLIGNFFNVALPGAVSGDFVKAFYVADTAPGQRGRAFGSILFDRVIGLSALAFVSAGALLLNLQSVWGKPFLNAIYPFVVMSAAGVFVFLAYLFLLNESKDPVLKILKSLEAKNKKFGSLARIYEGVRHYHSHRWVVVKAIAISIIVHLAIGFSCLEFLRAFDVIDVQAGLIFIVVPLGLLVTAVPVAPAGIGTGHVAFAYLFGLLGSNRGGDVFTLFVMCQLLIGALGGVVYLRYKKSGPSPLVQEQST